MEDVHENDRIPQFPHRASFLDDAVAVSQYTLVKKLVYLFESLS